MVKKLLAIFIIGLFFISSCSSGVPLITGKTVIKSSKEECEEQGNIWVSRESGSSCEVPLADAGKRCAKTLDCEGFCQGSKESRSSGVCSEVKKPSGCVFIVERGEKHERCFK